MGIRRLNVISFSESVEIIAFNEKWFNKRQTISERKKILEYTVTIFIDYVDQRELYLRVKEEFI